MGRYIDVGDVSVWYTDQGNGEPLVLLHGGLCTNDTWAAQMPTFARHFRVIAPERRGHGHTADVAGPLTYTAMAADMIGLLDQAVGMPAHLVGHSDGGIVGLMIAIARPDLVAKLVAISANIDPSGVLPELHGMFEQTSQMAPRWRPSEVRTKGTHLTDPSTGRSCTASSWKWFGENQTSRSRSLRVSRRPRSYSWATTTWCPSSTPYRCSGLSRSRN
jgi:pimeloyl-ACP methyl ester carboxylesterase